MTMIRVRMGPQNGIYIDDIRCQELLTQVRRSVDQNACGGAFDDDRRSGPPISRFVWIAGTPVIADARHSGCGPAPQYGELHMVSSSVTTLSTKFKKLSPEIGSAYCRERVCLYVYNAAFAVSLKNNLTELYTI